MMNSAWLERHLEEVKKLQSGDIGNKKKAIIIAVVFIVMVVFILAVGASDPNPAHDTKPVAALVAVAGVIVFLIVFFAGNNKNITKALQENLEQLLTTPEQVAQFDYEMSCKPVFDFDDGSKNSHIIFTEHYIGVCFLNRNIPDYRFARCSDIQEMRFSVSRDQSKVYGLGKLYDIDLIGADGKKSLGAVVHGKDRMQQFEEALQQYCPGIRLQEHKLLN